MLLLKLNKLKAERFRKIDYILATGLINEDVWLAGGSLRTLIDQNETICDYDLFFKDTNSFPSGHPRAIPEVQDKLIRLGFKLTFECPEGKLYTYTKNICPDRIWVGNEVSTIIKVQLITEHFYSSPEELLSTFDLSPTYFCTDGEWLWTNKTAIKSVKKKVCSLLKLSYPISSTFKRIIKYYEKGYSCLPAIETYMSNLLDSNRIQYTEETTRRYID
jgi:hypothetical protein